MLDHQMRRELQLLLVAGFGACLAYPLGVFAPLPIPVRLVLMAAFGPLLALGSFGLFRLIALSERSSAAGIGVAANTIAGALFASMILVQLSAGHRGEDARALAVWLGLDVAFDVYMGLGTIFLALAVMRHDWFGKPFAYTGLAIGSGLIVLNLATFPTPPAAAGLFDVGPLVGAWYLVITITAAIKLRRLGTQTFVALSPTFQHAGDRPA